MQEISGDIWELDCRYRVITTNGVVNSSGKAIMGKGIALQAKNRYLDHYPHINIDVILGKLIKAHGNHVYFICDNLISFPTKHHWRENSDIELIRRSAIELVTLLGPRLNCDDIVLLPPVGSGNGRLEWKNVKRVITPILDDHYYVVIR